MQWQAFRADRAIAAPAPHTFYPQWDNVVSFAAHTTNKKCFFTALSKSPLTRRIVDCAHQATPPDARFFMLHNMWLNH